LSPDPKPVMPFANAAAFRDWMVTHHESSQGIWLQIARRGSGISSVTYDESLDVALCFGWIDGQKAKFDESRWLQMFTPRRSRSKWSKINCTRAERLIASGEMAPAGLKQVEQAKADGRWEAAYAGQRTATVPEDLVAALEGNQAAREFFRTLDSTNRYAILYRIQDAKRPETRARRIEKFVAMLAGGEKLYP
jgi:uncharacterized protein YdeI (YjbR/CyaY-like superfamily)